MKKVIIAEKKPCIICAIMIEYKHLKRAKPLIKLQKAFSNLLYCFVIFHNVLFSGRVLSVLLRGFFPCKNKTFGKY